MINQRTRSAQQEMKRGSSGSCVLRWFLGTCPQTPEIFCFGPIAWHRQEGDAQAKRRHHATGPLPSHNAGSRPGAGCFSAEPYPPQRYSREYPPSLLLCKRSRKTPMWIPADQTDAEGSQTSALACRATIPSCYWRKRRLPRFARNDMSGKSPLHARFGRAGITKVR